MASIYDETTNKPVLMTLKTSDGETQNITSLEQLPADQIDRIVEAMLIEGELEAAEGLYELVDGLYLNQVYTAQ